MKIAGIKESLVKLHQALDAHSKVYYVRFGDGDLRLMDNDIKEDSKTRGNQQKNSEALRSELKESLNINDPSYLRAVSGSYPREPGMVDGLFVPFDNKKYLDNILKRQLYKENTPSIFLNPVLFHYLGVFKPKVLRDFINSYIRPQPKMFVGSCDRAAMESFLGKIKIYVETPAKNSYASIDSWWEGIENAYKDVKVIILASGQSSRVVTKRLWNIGAKVHCIDIGSVVDPVAGIFDTRTCWKLKGKEVRDYFYG